jgi:hypothetical protein
MQCTLCLLCRVGCYEMFAVTPFSHVCCSRDMTCFELVLDKSWALLEGWVGLVF